MTIQASTFDPSISAARAQEQVQGYWDNPLAPGQTHSHGSDALDHQDGGALASGDSPAAATSAAPAAAGDAVEINGGGTNAGGRTTGRTPDGKPIQIDPLHKDDTVAITRERTQAQGYISSDQLALTTGAGDDKVGVTQRDDGTLDIAINGKSYEVKLAQGQEVTIRAGAGNDTIEVAPNVRVNIVVDGGAGNDAITTGAGDDRIDGGTGDDVINGGEGRNDVFGNSGNDTIGGGSGVNVVYGGDGDDVIRAGTGTNYLEGGAGADTIHGGGASDIITAGAGNDRVIVGSGASTVYAGAGDDTIDNAGAKATVYAEVGDLVNASTGAKPTVVNVEIDSSLGSSIVVQGSAAFVQRMQAELDFLRSSPNGQQMLAEFDKAAAGKGNSVTIKELANEQNGYAQTFSNDADIRNGKPGAGGDVTISYNPSFHMDAFPAPSVVLYHEMSHAYNGVNGTFQPGTYRGTGPDSGNVPNAERQAVGLETSATPFDFDGDKSTAPTTANPDHLTENGIRAELGLPDRPAYTL